MKPVCWAVLLQLLAHSLTLFALSLQFDRHKAGDFPVGFLKKKTPEEIREEKQKLREEEREKREKERKARVS